MSIVTFECELQSEELNRLQFPVEIRKHSLALVTWALTHEETEIAPGTYHVSMRLPTGQQIWDCGPSLSVP